MVTGARAAGAPGVAAPEGYYAHVGGAPFVARRSRAQAHRHRAKARAFRLGAACGGPPGLSGGCDQLGGGVRDPNYGYEVDGRSLDDKQEAKKDEKPAEAKKEEKPAEAAKEPEKKEPEKKEPEKAAEAAKEAKKENPLKEEPPKKDDYKTYYVTDDRLRRHLLIPAVVCDAFDRAVAEEMTDPTPCTTEQIAIQALERAEQDTSSHPFWNLPHALEAINTLVVETINP